MNKTIVFYISNGEILVIEVLITMNKLKLNDCSIEWF